MAEGYIKLYRKFTTWEWYDDINTSRLFLHLLLTANWKDVVWHGITIKRGSKLTSRSKLAKETGLTEDQVKTCLNKLISTNEITKESTNKYTVINVVKYGDYQVSSNGDTQQNTKQDNQQMPNNHTNECQSNANQIPTNKEIKELKEIKEDNNTSLKEINKQINNQEKPSLFEMFEDEFKRPLTQVEMQRLFDWQKEHGEQLVMYALREAILNNAYHFNYIDKILCEWQRNGMTAEKYEEREANEKD